MSLDLKNRHWSGFKATGSKQRTLFRSGSEVGQNNLIGWQYRPRGQLFFKTVLSIEYLVNYCHPFGGAGCRFYTVEHKGAQLKHI